MPSNRRVTLYFAWDKQGESGRPLDKLNNRFPALHELRRAAWPMLQHFTGGAQGISGFLDRVVLGDFSTFLQVVAEETGVEPIVISGRESDGIDHSLREVFVSDPQTIIIVSLDHFRTHRSPSIEDITEIRKFLARPEAMLIVCPHHYVGGEDDDEDECGEGGVLQRQIQEHRHHGDSLVPAVQRLGGYARALLAALELPMENLYGLRPALDKDGQPARLEVDRVLDEERFLGGDRGLPVHNFNAHMHLPHLKPVGIGVAAYHVLARQLISPEADTHPFAAEGNTYFNALLWAPPVGARRGHVLVCDATIWSDAFMGGESLKNFWRNLAARPVN